MRDLAKVLNLAERHVGRQLRLAYLAPGVLKRLVYKREPTAITLCCSPTALRCRGASRRRCCLENRKRNDT